MNRGKIVCLGILSAVLLACSFQPLDTSRGWYHQVQKGETLWSIGRQYDRDPELLAYLNDVSDPKTLQIGQYLYVPPYNFNLPTAKPGTQRKLVAQGSKKSTVTSKSNGKRVAGADKETELKKTATAKKSSVASSSTNTQKKQNQNYGASSGKPTSSVASRTSQRKPTPKQVASARSSTQASRGGSYPRGDKNSSGYDWPVKGAVTRTFSLKNGKVHKGIDIAAGSGTPVRAAAAGTVIYSGDEIAGYGNLIILDHGKGWSTIYAHNKKNLCKVNQRVRQGEIIGLVGSTGRALGNHLHFEIRHDARPQDPLRYLPTHR